MGLLVVFHFISLDQVPPIGVLEGWRVDSAYSFYTEGTFTPSMFPGLAEYNHGPFGLGKYKYLLQSFSFHLLDFGVYQARLPLLLGGFLVVYLVYLLGCLLYHEEAALIAAGLFLLSPMFYETHFSGSHAWVAVCLLLAVYFLLTEKLIRFLRARKVTYLIADEYFKDSLKALIPPAKWEQIFRVEAELSSAIYGGPSTGGQPPYQIQVWRLTSGSEG